MSDQDTHLVYHLPRTKVRVTAAATEKTDAGTGERRVEATTNIALETQADAQAYFRILLDDSHFSDNEFTLELSEAGLLVATDAAATGRLGKIVKGVFGLVTSVVSIFSGLGAAAGGALLLGEIGEEPGRPDYGRDHPELAARRTTTKRAIETLAQTLVELEVRQAGTASEEDRAKTTKHIADVKSGLEVLRSEATLLAQHYAAWKTTIESAASHTFEYAYDLEDLPMKAVVDGWESRPPAGVLGPLQALYDLTGQVLARVDDPRPATGGLSEASGTARAGVYIRQSRPIALCLYKTMRDSVGDRLVLSKHEAVHVMDKNSRLGFVEFGKTKWSKKSAKVEFYANGTFKKLTNSTESAAAAVVQTLSELPDAALASIKKANEIIDAQQELSFQRTEQWIAELEKRKKAVEGEIALNGVLATKEQQEEKKKLDAEIALLKSRMDLGTLAAEFEVQTSGHDAKIETDILGVHVELEKARVERLKVEADLAKLRDAVVPG